MFVESVRITNYDVVAGTGCKSLSSLSEGDSLGFEFPTLAFPAYYSQRLIPCCSFCFRHALPFHDLVEILCRKTMDSQLEPMEGVRESIVTFCLDCSIGICSDCRAKEAIHVLICPGDNSMRRQWFKRLYQLSFQTSESLLLAGLFFAELLAKGVGLEDPRFSYFALRDSEISPNLLEARALFEQLVGSPIELDQFKMVVDTFDNTNLFLEIENASMLTDVAEGCMTEEKTDTLKQVFKSLGYPAMTRDADDVPLPVVVGSGHYPTVARLNHSCDPNIEWRSVNGTNKVEFIALRGIEKNEELFISYIDQSLSREEREAELLRLYGFACTCSRCR